ncbi:unnamed protein product [Pedinophyceae sp. YPF-701]|nr:unnamed protein product [Pedinophyceae sp. YPF-701]
MAAAGNEDLRACEAERARLRALSAGREGVAALLCALDKDSREGLIEAVREGRDIEAQLREHTKSWFERGPDVVLDEIEAFVRAVVIEGHEGALRDGMLHQDRRAGFDGPGRKAQPGPSMRYGVNQEHAREVFAALEAHQRGRPSRREMRDMLARAEAAERERDELRRQKERADEEAKKLREELDKERARAEEAASTVAKQKEVIDAVNNLWGLAQGITSKLSALEIAPGYSTPTTVQQPAGGSKAGPSAGFTHQNDPAGARGDPPKAQNGEGGKKLGYHEVSSASAGDNGGVAGEVAKAQAKK